MDRRIHPTTVISTATPLLFPCPILARSALSVNPGAVHRGTSLTVVFAEDLLHRRPERSSLH